MYRAKELGRNQAQMFTASMNEKYVRRLAVEHILGMLAAGDTVDDLLRAYPWLEREDVVACLAYARRVVGHERVEPAITDEAA